MTHEKLLTAYKNKDISLPNRVAMAPMNRRRAKNGIPAASMITYYQQRVSAGLIITDNTAISSNGGAYLNTPGIYNKEQQLEWKKVVDAVHQKNGRIFMQLVHAGRVGHSGIQNGEPLVAPSAIAVAETIRLPDDSYELMTKPMAIPAEKIPYWVDAYKEAATRAIEIGFDGVEIHAAHGFLIDQFINPYSNHRTDDYGGSVENRTRFLFEVMQAVVSAIGSNRTGIRLSPFREIYDIKPYAAELATHQYIMEQLQKMDILYVHFSNVILDGQSIISPAYMEDARKRFKNLIIIAGGFTVESAEEILQSNLVDLVAFGKLYISNPDLVERIRYNKPLANWEEDTFYRGGDRGYIDYPLIESMQRECF